MSELSAHVVDVEFPQRAVVGGADGLAVEKLAVFVEKRRVFWIAVRNPIPKHAHEKVRNRKVPHVTVLGIELEARLPGPVVPDYGLPNADRFFIEVDEAFIQRTHLADAKTQPELRCGQRKVVRALVSLQPSQKAREIFFRQRRDVALGFAHNR